MNSQEVPTNQTFATLIACIDGRVLASTVAAAKARFGVDHIDTVTAPGVVGQIGRGQDYAPILAAARVSLSAHASRQIAVCGHEGCAGNPVPQQEQIQHIRASCAALRTELGPDIEICGLFAYLNGEVEWIDS